MLVDDDEDDREIFLMIVSKAYPSMSISIATNGEDALQQLQNAANLPDMIFLDLNMPLMNGRELMQALKADERLKPIPTIILSTSSHPPTITEMKAMGAKEFITKPDKYSTWEKMLKDLFINPPL